MYFDKSTLTANKKFMPHWQALWSQRKMWDIAHKSMFGTYKSAMQNDPQTLAANTLLGDGLGNTFWAEIDRQIIEMRDQEVGLEIINDLSGVQTVLPVGKTAKLYNLSGGIADDVSISIDGQAPYSFDHTEYASDGDPVPAFTAGYGVSWRLAQGLNTENINIVLDSQMEKLREFNKTRVSYYLKGSDKIQVANYPAQGITNHRNTIKINLGSGAGGLNINLTTASYAELLAFFGPTGAFGVSARNNRVTRYDVLWVSNEIWANLSQPYLIEINSGANAINGGSVLDGISKFIPAASIRPTFALKGNEFLAYQRRRDVITPLVGMPTNVVALPRPMPQTNYNFQIMSVEGIQIKRDANGLSGVLYGANLTG